MSAPQNPGGPVSPGTPDDASNRAQNDTPEQTIKRFLDLLFKSGDVFEIRIPKCRDRANSDFQFTASGYFSFDSIEKAVEAIIARDEQALAPAIYVTMNPVNSALLARCRDVIKNKMRETTSDADIVRRTHILIDIDADRPAGISATDAELAKATQKKDAVLLFLRARGFPEPIVTMSGNGHGVLLAVDLPADDGELVERFLKRLAELFDGDGAHIDTSVGNAARITKIPGTMARKGEDLRGITGVEDRPHRRATQISAPSSMETVRTALLEETAGCPRSAQPAATVRDHAGSRQATPTGQFTRFPHTAAGVRSYLREFGIEVGKERRRGSTTILDLQTCPITQVEAAGTEISVLIGDDGRIGFRNLHSRGLGLSWLDLRDALEPGYKEWAKRRGEAKADPISPVLAGNIRIEVLGQGDKGKLVLSAIDLSGKEVHRDLINVDSAASRKRFTAAVDAKGLLSEDEAESLDTALLGLESPLEASVESDEPEERSPETALAARDARADELIAHAPNDAVEEARRMLSDPGLIDLVLDDLCSVGVVGESNNAILLYLQGCSRLLPRPFSVRMQGTSSSGKSHLIQSVASLFPEEAKLVATSMTMNALYYLPFGSLMHTFVVAGERSRKEDDDQAEATRALREMISARELSKAVPVKSPDGSFTTKNLHQPGPIAFVESTTSTSIIDEDENRCLQVSTDESSEQTARVVDAIAETATLGTPDRAEVILRHHVLQRLLRRVQVRVPFARAIARAMPRLRPEERRAISDVIAVVQSVAVLHQLQRAKGPLANGDVIEADLHDYVVARRVLLAPIGRAAGGGRSLPEAVARFGVRLREHFHDEEFSSTDALGAEKILSSKGKVNEYLRKLEAAGVVECVEDSRGSKPARWKVVGTVPEPGAAWLPTVQQIEEAMR